MANIRCEMLRRLLMGNLLMECITYTVAYLYIHAHVNRKLKQGCSVSQSYHVFGIVLRRDGCSASLRYNAWRHYTVV